MSMGCKGEGVSCHTWFGGDISLWYMGTIVLGGIFQFTGIGAIEVTHESSPTPNPLMSRPRIIDHTPTVNV